MPNKPFIPIILGTARKGRESEKVSTALFETLTNRDDCEVEVVDVKDHTHGYTFSAWENHPQTAPWKEMAKKASAFIFVVPEYNHGYPGELKIALDSAYTEYAKKPVLIYGVSSGGFGGTRVVENLIPVLRQLDMLVTANTMHISNVGEFEADENFKEKANKAVDTLIEMI